MAASTVISRCGASIQRTHANDVDYQVCHSLPLFLPSCSLVAVIVNAADNKQRDPNMDKLEVDIDAESNTISVKNNGDGIPIEMHKEEKCYVPTLIFGQLLTGSNFDDSEEKTTGGRNGFGAKLANIFSTEFIVECCDAKRGLKFKQVFTDNMHTAGKPIIKDCTAAEKKKGDWTKITFSPDLERFKME